MNKTRIGKRDAELLSDIENVGIIWKDKTKSIILETEQGFTALNKRELSLKGNYLANSKAKFLDRIFENDIQFKKAYKFATADLLLNWFAK